MDPAALLFDELLALFRSIQSGPLPKGDELNERINDLERRRAALAASPNEVWGRCVAAVRAVATRFDADEKVRAGQFSALILTALGAAGTAAAEPGEAAKS